MSSWLRFFCIISVALCMNAIGARTTSAQTQSPQTQSPQSNEQQVEAVEQRWLDHDNQPDVVQAILADDFVHVLGSGFITKDDQLNFLQQHPNAFPGAKHFEELHVRVYGDVAIATGIVNNVRDANSKPKRTAFTDVFVRRNGKWLAVNAQETPLEPKSTPASQSQP